MTKSACPAELEVAEMKILRVSLGGRRIERIRNEPIGGTVDVNLEVWR